jgi:hypothetical protein
MAYPTPSPGAARVFIDTPAVGDALEFWRVETFEPGRRLRRAAEMKLPGRAWLEFDVVTAGNDTRW